MSVVVIGLAAVYLNYRWAFIEAHVYDALWAVATASLEYLQESGTVENDVRALIEAGMFKEDLASGRLKSGRPDRYAGTYADGVASLGLKFPASVDGYTLRDDQIVVASDGTPLVVIDCYRLSDVNRLPANEYFARRWYLIMKELKQAGGGASTRPTSAPSSGP